MSNEAAAAWALLYYVINGGTRREVISELQNEVGTLPDGFPGPNTLRQIGRHMVLVPGQLRAFEREAIAGAHSRRYVGNPVAMAYWPRKSRIA